MSLQDDIVSEVTKDGVKITTYKDGSQHFETIESCPEEKPDERSWWQKVKDWFKSSDIKPYIKVRDLADPFGDRRNDPDDKDAGSDGATGAEIGIKISF